MHRLCIFSIVILYSGLLFSCDSNPVYTSLPVKGDRVVIDMGTLQKERPEFFSITVDKKTIGFFVVKIDESVESYLDACMKCYPNQKGYRVGDSHLECKFCNVRYPMDSLKTGVGSCFPIPIKGKVEGEEYSISIQDLQEVEKFF